MKVIYILGFFCLMLSASLFAQNSTDVAKAKKDNESIKVQEDQQYDFFIDRDGDGICDNRTLRNKSVISQKGKFHHYRMISYKFDYRFKCQFGTPAAGEQGHHGNNGQGNGGHHGGP